MSTLFYWTGALVWISWAIVVATGLVWWALGVLKPVKAKTPPVCEHARQLLEPSWGDLVYRCLDCGTTTPLGHVFPSDYCHRKAS